MPRSSPPEDLRAIRDKYERLHALRVAHERAKTEPSFIEPDPRPAMARLAEEFPGALRELDMLPLETVTARITSLEAAERDAAQAEPWMQAQASFHRLARGALVTKRWLGGRKHITDAVRHAFLAEVDSLPRPDDARLFVDHLAEIAAPPRGRVLEVVYRRLADELGTTVAEARALVAVPRASARGG